MLHASTLSTYSSFLFLSIAVDIVRITKTYLSNTFWQKIIDNIVASKKVKVFVHGKFQCHA